MVMEVKAHKRKRRMTRDTAGQIHVLEAVAAAMLFFGALQMGVQMMPDSQSTTALDTLEVTGNDALRSLYLLPPSPGTPDAHLYRNSSLIYYIITTQTWNITEYLNQTLDTILSYSLYYRIFPGGSEVELFSMVMTISESVAAHLCFYHDDSLYDVRLLLWKEPRGLTP